MIERLNSTYVEKAREKHKMQMEVMSELRAVMPSKKDIA